MYGHKLIRELLGLLFLFCGLLMLLSLWSYDISDPTFNQAVSIDASSIKNSAGLFGAYLSGFLVDVFGACSFLWVVFFLAVGAGLVSRWLVLKWYRWIGYALLFVCMLTLSSVMDITFHGIHGGGLLGQWISAISYLFFSPSGSLLVWFFLFLIAMELSFSVPWLALVAAIVGFFGSKVVSRKEHSQDEDAEEGEPAASPNRRLPAISGLLGRKKEKEERPRPVLDIVMAERSASLAEEESSLALEPIPARREADPAALAEFLALVEEPEKPARPAAIELPTAQENDAPAEEEVREVPENGEDPFADLPDLVDTVPASEERAVEESLQQEEAEDVPASFVAALAVPALAAEDVPAVFSAPLSAEQGIPAEEDEEGQDEDELPFDMPAQPAPAVQYGSAAGDELLEKDEEYASVDEAVAAAMAVQAEIEAQAVAAPAPAPVLPKRRELVMPPLDLLSPVPEDDARNRPDSMVLAKQGEALITCLKNFNVHAKLAKITPGPVVTMFEVRPDPGVKATRITNLANDLAMSLKAVAVRMLAPVPGTDTVGVEVPNENRATVFYREIVENEGFQNAKSLLTVALGKDTGGRPVSADLAKMPHLLVAGATGAGKSVCLNSIILSLLYRARPDEVQMILVDPKQVELSMYADLPHLVHPVVTDMDLTKNALLWAIDEMNRRLKLFAKVKVRNITGFNERQARLRDAVLAGDPVPVDSETGEPEDLTNMPFLVIIVDELADLMMVKRKEVEGSIVRLAQLARAAGIHLIIATQRPSVDVVTGLIKANFPCRIAFKVTSGQDSRTILDVVGAEKLLGMGDMLFKPNGGTTQRLHGAFVSDEEVASVVEFWKKQQAPNYKVDFAEFGNDEEESEDMSMSSGRSGSDDPIYNEAVQFVLERGGKISISLLQRRFSIGFNRAARYVEQMERDGIRTQGEGPRGH